MSVGKSPPKTVYENNWNYKHALSVVFHSNSSPESSIIIFINGVRFSSECKNKLFSWRFFLLQASWCQVMEFRRVKTCLNIEGKKSLHVTSGPQDTIARRWSEISGRIKKPLFLPWQLFTVDCLPLELWEKFTSREIMRWLWNEACRYGLSESHKRGSCSLLVPKWTQRIPLRRQCVW